MFDVRNPSKHSSESRRKIIKPASDCISSLPDEILHSILSNIPTKLAITTSVLSKRWTHVWCKTPSLSIDRISQDCRRIDPSSINKTLRRFSAPKITSFDLRIGYDVTASQIDSWIELAMSRNAETLSLTIINAGYSFRDSFFINSSVKQLSVFLGCKNIIPPCIVSWTSLRSLSLNRCNISNESIANIISGCPMLESLELHIYRKLNHLDLSKSLRLTRLKIVAAPVSYSTKYGPVKIVVPHIHYLSLRCRSFQEPYVLVDVSSLTEANLNIECFVRGISKSHFKFLQDMLLEILTKMQSVEKLTVGTIVLQILSLADLRGVTFPQLKIKTLIVETMVIRSVIPGIERLLQNSPELKKITIHTTKSRAIWDREFEGYLNTEGLNPDQCWSKKYEVIPTAVDTDSKHVASFIKIVLKKAKTLETMVLRLEGYLNATEYRKLLRMDPTVSSRNKKKKVRKYGYGKAVLKSFKIIP